ncbi:hypothetical protein ZIOFF_031933 [Zingiber officinale]|uniref:Homeobox-leucine zipper protein n=1 Tax=Zingiber officinale TaxID=94328 RepID=A0A8J5GFV1_ZINOF|nr:hypothetical protein ZIOFF_031933 [Zingiber officinale]
MVGDLGLIHCFVRFIPVRTCSVDFKFECCEFLIPAISWSRQQQSSCPNSHSSCGIEPVISAEVQRYYRQAVDYLILGLAGVCLGILAKSSNDSNLGASGYTYTIIAVWLRSAEEHGATKRLFFTSPDEIYEEEYYEEQLPEKKRRLTPDQVNLLERSFEEENKLEPERKRELAQKLGMQPRQVAVWFQNQRARWKNKQLEQDFDRLKSSYESLLADHAALFKDNEGLRLEKLSLDPQLKSKDVVEATKQVSVAHTGSSNAKSSSMWTPSEGWSAPILSEFIDGGNYYVHSCYASPAYFFGGGELTSQGGISLSIGIVGLFRGFLVPNLIHARAGLYSMLCRIGRMDLGFKMAVRTPELCHSDYAKPPLKH